MGVVGQKCDWQHSMAHPWKSPYRCKNLADISYTDRVLSQILFHGNRCRSEKNAVCSIQWLILKIPLPIGAKISQISFTQAELANFVSNFIGIATGVGQGKCNWQHSMAHPRKSPYRCKNLLLKPSYSPFCPKFRCHGNGGRSGKMQLTAFDGASPKPPP